MKVLPAIAALSLTLAAAGGAQASSSAWLETDGARIRLVTTGAPDAQGHLKGMLDIQLKPGWKTYWRDPGDAGVPPTIDVSANPDIERVDIDFPVPQRHDEGDFQWAGYDYPVALPVTFTFKAGSGSSPIEADVFLGVCETICVPVQAKFSVDPAAASGRSAGRGRRDGCIRGHTGSGKAGLFCNPRRKVRDDRDVRGKFSGHALHCRPLHRRRGRVRFHDAGPGRARRQDVSSPSR